MSLLKKEANKMAVFRIEKTRDYKVMANHHLRNMALSLKAKVLLSLIISQPEDWDYITKDFTFPLLKAFS